jgi:hypothetical protein
MIDQNDVLALLEAGPQAQADLTIWLSHVALDDETNARLVRHELNRMKRAGQIKRVGEVGRLALASYVAPIGRPPNPDKPPRVRQRTVRPVPCIPCPPAVQIPVSPPAQLRTEGAEIIRVVDGVEFVVVDYEQLLREKLAHWLSRGGSSLSRSET